MISDDRSGLRSFEEKDLNLIPARRPDSNKGSYGRVLVVAGCINMAGAALLSAKAAYRSGCGIVRVLTCEENRVIIQSALPEAILTTYSSNMPDQTKIDEAIDWASVIVCGPGLGTGSVSAGIVKRVLEYSKVPVVLDADGLNIVSQKHRDWLKDATCEVIITPHILEMARLVETDAPSVKAEKALTARMFSDSYGVSVILKDASTVIAIKDGATFVNTTGNHGMATAGSGDVLTGVIGALIAQGLDCGMAAPLGVFIHGMAGDEARKKLGAYGMMAGDIIEALPIVFMKRERDYSHFNPV